jgi:putative transposase
VRKKYQRKDRKSNHKFEVVGGQELLVRVPLPIAEVWAEMQAHVEQLTGQAGLQILRAILENEVTHRVGPPHRPNPSAGCVRWGKQPGYVVFAGQKIPLERPRVRTREGQEVELRSVAAGRQAATSGAGAHGGRTVHAALSASGGKCSGRVVPRQN